MNYLDVRHLGKDIGDRFKSQGRQCDVNLLGTTDSQLTLRMQRFGQEDLWDMATVAAGYNVVITNWAVVQPGSTIQTLKVTLHVTEVHENGQPKDG